MGASFLTTEGAIYFFNYLPWLIWLVILVLIGKKDRAWAGKILLALLLGEILEKVLKLFSRPRPLGEGFVLPAGILKSSYNGGSFPSGHALKSAILFWGLFFLTGVKGKWLAILAGGFLLILWWRIIIGFHYPVDILGGLLIGTLLGWGVKKLKRTGGIKK